MMALKTKLILATTFFVVILFGVSEWLSYRQTSLFIEQYTNLLVNRVDHDTALAQLQEGRGRLLASTTTIRIIHAILTVLASVAALNLLWYRLLLRPIQQLLSHINIMGRGTWINAIPVERKDEIGELTVAFNELGEKLSCTVKQFAAASKLSALALLGNRMVRRITLAKDHVSGVAILLKAAKQYGQGIPQAAINNLQFTAKSLEQLEHQFQVEFDQEFLKLTEQQNGISKEEEAVPILAGSQS